MASIAATLSGLSAGGRIYKPGKGYSFGAFTCEIHLEQIAVRPYQRINGRIEISTSNEIKCFGNIRGSFLPAFTLDIY